MNGRELRILALLVLLSTAGFVAGHELRHGQVWRAVSVFLVLALASIVAGALVQARPGDVRRDD